MTQTFTVKDWTAKNGNYVLGIGLKNPLDEMPVIQVYIYPDTAPTPMAILFNILQVAYLTEKNQIELIHHEPINGHVVFI